MNKKIKIGMKPTNKSIPLTADAWVGSHKGNTSGEMKRLTIDIPETLHRLMKVSCASRGTKMADEVRELLTKKYGK
ncbi:plasmid partition protein ParG [Bartonella sp. AU55XJBT]|uniref:plasmid partition protein ParG n=1 Tax=Bartonella sp. AU55XJBT TaxID=3019091 RepID=UPI0023623B7D|nr:plasmid partition protein ParG [Bartonella sp. AU55XJBT]